MTRAAPSLVALVMRRIVLFSALAMFAQFIGVVAEYWFDEQQLARHAVQREASALYGGVRRRGDALEFELPPDARERYARGDYLARVRTQKGAILFSNCGDDCDRLFLPTNQPAPQFWMTQIAPGKPLRLAGGQSFADGPGPVIVDVAILRDSDGALFAVLAHEVVDHMALPMSLMLVVVLGATALSINKALRPVKEAAALASGFDAVAHARLPTEGMPGEIAQFAQAVNASFDKIRDLMQSQKIFTSAISHEVRTPLGVARLELEKIADPRARNVEKDLDALNRLVEQLTTLARLEGAELGAAQMVEPLQIAESVVASLAPLIYDSGRSIALIDAGATPFRGHAALVETAIRTLVENAIRHTRPGAAILVEAGPGAGFCVRDAAAGAPAASGAEGVGLGLKIVRRIAEIHGGRFDFGPSQDGRGSTARLAFDSR